MAALVASHACTCASASENPALRGTASAADSDHHPRPSSSAPSARAGRPALPAAIAAQAAQCQSGLPSGSSAPPDPPAPVLQIPSYLSTYPSNAQSPAVQKSPSSPAGSSSRHSKQPNTAAASLRQTSARRNAPQTSPLGSRTHAQGSSAPGPPCLPIQSVRHSGAPQTHHPQAMRPRGCSVPSCRSG